MNITSTFRGKKHLVAVAIAAVVMALPAASAEIYQWKDENGNTVFSERRPPAGNAAVVRIKAGKASGDAAARLQADRDRLAPPKPAPADTKKAELTPEQKAQRADACSQARHALKLLQENNRPRYEAEDGQLIIMSVEEKAARMADAEQKIGEYCD